MHFIVSLFFVGCIFVLTNASIKDHPGPKIIDETSRWSKCVNQSRNLYAFNVDTLDDKSTNLEEFKGQVLLVINVATFCAFTQQYIDFNPLIQKYHDNLTIIAFPCNQFFLQEPAENHEILNGLMHVRPGNGWKPHSKLRIFGKLKVNGEQHHPLYEFLKDSCPPTYVEIGKREELYYSQIRTHDITWNFEKFLIDKNGVPRFRFHPTAWSHGNVVEPFIKQLIEEN